MEPVRTDAELIAESLDRPETFAEIFDRHASVLASYLIRRVGEADGESLLGELFRVAFESRDRFLGSRPDARPWLYGIASNLVLKQFRSDSRHLSATRRLAGQRETATTRFDERVAEDAEIADLWSRVSTAIGELPNRDREVVLLYAFEDLTYSEIAEALEIPVGTVRSRLNRVRATLREIPRASQEDDQARTEQEESERLQ